MTGLSEFDTPNLAVVSIPDVFQKTDTRKLAMVSIPDAFQKTDTPKIFYMVPLLDYLQISDTIRPQFNAIILAR